MANQNQKAHDELAAAQRDLSEALMTINSIQTWDQTGMRCACNADGPCAYHADLLNRLLEVIRRVDGIYALLGQDLANPGRNR